jgi:hypothetical protein
MRTSVRDGAAITLTEELYDRLAAGDPVEAAVSEARLALYSISPSSHDWAIPILFVRSAPVGAPTETQKDAETHTPLEEPVNRGSSQKIYNLGEVGRQVNASGEILTINLADK